MKIPIEIIEAVKGNIVAVTGAGVSKASGIPVFRGKDGLWKNYRAEELATPEAFRTNPTRVWEWYIYRLNIIMNAKPNTAHITLVELEKSSNFTLITQNVDGIHREAGSQNILEIHGNIRRIWCTYCNHRTWLKKPPDDPPYCPHCKNLMRPDVVWFGESLNPEILNKAVKAVESADICLVVGTSGIVMPAAALPHYTKRAGGFVVEFNPQNTPITPIADLNVPLPAEIGLPKFVNALE
ncbi:MAG: NAD-dependent deacylase [Promethearchaeota archaeon]